MGQMFDKEIEGYQKELQDILDLMEKARVAFADATASSLTQWYQTQARFYVQDQYDLTLEIGRDKLARMKKKITQLVSMAPASVQRLLDDDKLWWHRCRDGGWRDPLMEGAPERLGKTVKRLSALLTPILLEFGYIKPNPDVTSVDTTHKPNAKPRRFAPPDLTWSQKMTNSITLYKEHLGRATFLDGKIKEAIKLKKKYEAGTLWDKI